MGSMETDRKEWFIPGIEGDEAKGKSTLLPYLLL